MKNWHSPNCNNLSETDRVPEIRGTSSPQLLVSVRNAQEALQAATGGVDWIDLKDPQHGPLGPVDAKIAREVAAAFSTSHSLSAAAGELQDWRSPSNTIAPVASFYHHERTPGNSGHHLMNIPGIRLLKLGLAGCNSYPHWRDRWCVIQEEIQQAGKQLVAVVYADWEEAAAPHPDQIMEQASNNGCKTLLVDTYCKTKGTILDCLRLGDLNFLLERARKKSLQTVVAGSLSIDSLSQIVTLPISLIAVRGAVCVGGRNGILQKTRIEQFQRTLRALPWEHDCN